MVTTKEIESDREEYILGYNTCKEDVNKLIDEMPKFNHYGGKSGSVYKGVLVKELKARING